MVPTVAPFLIQKLRELDDSLGPLHERVLSKRDPEAIHDFRVAIRRLRVLLKVSRDLFGRFLADAVSAPFTQIHRESSALRDAEVLSETAGAATLVAKGGATWKTRRKQREGKLRREFLSHLAGSGQLASARKLLDALLTLPVRPERDVPLEQFARRAVLGARRRVEVMRDASLEDGDALHALRIAYKYLRYTTEIFAPALPADMVVLAKVSASFQKILGEIHDTDVALGTLRAARGLAAREKRALERALVQKRAEHVTRYQQEMHPTSIPPPKPG